MHVKFKKSSQIGLAKFLHCFVCHVLPSPIMFCLLKYGWDEYDSLSCITMEVTNTHIVEPFAQPWVSEHGNLPCSPFLMGFSFFCTLSMGITCKLHTSHPWEPYTSSRSNTIDNTLFIGTYFKIVCVSLFLGLPCPCSIYERDIEHLATFFAHHHSDLCRQSVETL